VISGTYAVKRAHVCACDRQGAHRHEWKPAAAVPNAVDSQCEHALVVCWRAQTHALYADHYAILALDAAAAIYRARARDVRAVTLVKRMAGMMRRDAIGWHVC
jgi:hypothetical protein